MTSREVGEGLEVSVVDPDEAGARPRARSTSSRSWTSTRGVRPSAEGLLMQGRKVLVRQDPGDEEDPVGPGCPGLQKLDRVKNEVLPEDRKVHRAPAPPRGRPRTPRNTRSRSAR